MNPGFIIQINKDALNVDLLRTADDSLPRVIRNMNICLPFVGMLDGETIAVCLAEDKGVSCDIASLAVSFDMQNKGYGKEMLAYVLDFFKSRGARYADTGCSNSDIRLITFFQRAGFRFNEIWQDYYIEDSKTASVENSIIRRDMVRFRKDLDEKYMGTTGYDASGRK